MEREKELNEKKNDLITRAEEVLDKAKAEKRELTEDEAAELAEIRDNVRRIIKSLKLEGDLEEMSKESERAKGACNAMNDTEKRSIEEIDREAFANFIRGTINTRDNSGELSPASGVGGALIPTTIVKEIIKKIYDLSPVLERSYRFSVKGNLDLPYYPADSDNITVAYQSEFSPIASSTGDFASVTLGYFLAGALTKISRTLINNTDIDIVSFIVEEMAYGIRRFIEGELLNPSDPTHKIKGMSELTNGVTAAAQTAITADEVVKLHDKIKDAYQGDAIWVMSPATRTALRLLKDNMGRYLLQDDISAPFGTTLLGKPVYVSDNMPDIAAGKAVIYYGDFKGLAVNFSEEISVEVLRERFADEHAYGVIGWFCADARVVNQQRLAVLKMHSA